MKNTEIAMLAAGGLFLVGTDAGKTIVQKIINTLGSGAGNLAEDLTVRISSSALEAFYKSAYEDNVVSGIREQIINPFQDAEMNFIQGIKNFLGLGGFGW